MNSMQAIAQVNEVGDTWGRICGAYATPKGRGAFERPCGVRSVETRNTNSKPCAKQPDR